MDSLVSTEWLAQEIGASDLRIVDATKHLAGSGRDAREEYQAGHIPGAVFMDLADLADTAHPVEGMLPSPEKFASRMQSLGLGDGSRIVIYDDSAVKTAARAWYMLKLFGAHDVAILDGGIAKWKAEGRALAQGAESRRHRHYTAWHDPARVRDKAQILANLASHAEQVIDARGAARFTGAEGDPRPGIGAGHIPGSRNVPFTALYAADGTFKSNEEIRGIFTAAGVDLDQPLVTSCGTGVTACVLLFALDRIGKRDTALYDGSWSEWGADPATPKETGAAD
ncbi:MAG: 3-mercaptopyruvate sulfurtransferase [Novosphingobium sp.]